MKDFPVYIFDVLDDRKAEAEALGKEVINLTVGDPDTPTPEPIVSTLLQTANDGCNHHYPSYKGMPEFRKAVARWYKQTFNVDLNPEDEVLLTIGSKSGLAMLPLALVNPGEGILLPDPCYPAYKPAATLSGGEIFWMPLLEKYRYLPKLDEIPSEIARKTKLIILNYPNNPTAAVAPVSFWHELVEFVKYYDIYVAHDIPYSEITFDGFHQESFLSVPGAKDVGVEFHSFSKSFNMTGWRIGFAVGNSDIIGGLGKIRSNVDMGVFLPIQYAAITAIETMPDFPRQASRIYQSRRDVLVSGLRSLGWEVNPPQATFFMWMRVPEPTPSMEFVEKVLERTGVLMTPGIGFGENGEGYIRVALTVNESVLREAVERLRIGGFVYRKSRLVAVGS